MRGGKPGAVGGDRQHHAQLERAAVNVGEQLVDQRFATVSCSQRIPASDMTVSSRSRSGQTGPRTSSIQVAVLAVVVAARFSSYEARPYPYGDGVRTRTVSDNGDRPDPDQASVGALHH